MVGSRRNTVPAFDWLNDGRDVMRLQFRLQTVVQHQWMSQRAAGGEKTVVKPGAAVLDRSRIDAAGGATVLSPRQVKRAKRAERDASMVDVKPPKRDTSKDVCKFGETCRDFIKTGKCGYLHRS